MNAAIGNNKFLRVLIAAKRAKQIHKGARPLVQSLSTRDTRIALEEVEQGLISFEFMPQESDPRSGRDTRTNIELSKYEGSEREAKYPPLAIRIGG